MSIEIPQTCRSGEAFHPNIVNFDFLVRLQIIIDIIRRLPTMVISRTFSVQASCSE